MAKKKQEHLVMTPEELDAIAGEVYMMESFCAQYRATVLDLLEKDIAFENASLVPKRAMPKWTDPAGAEQAIAKARLLPKSVYMEQKLMPPGRFRDAIRDELKAEKVRPAVQVVLDFIKQESSGNNLVIAPPKGGQFGQ